MSDIHQHAIAEMQRIVNRLQKAVTTSELEDINMQEKGKIEMLAENPETKVLVQVIHNTSTFQKQVRLPKEKISRLRNSTKKK
jgi:hypothetical protein